MKYIFLLLAVVIGNCGYSSDGVSDVNGKANSLFSSYVSGDSVNYSAIKSNPESLTEAVKAFEEFNAATLSGNAAKSFWINAYNVMVIKSVVEYYPIQSPMDVKGFFDTKKHSVGGRSVTLNDIENNILRKQFKDARLHFALVCAAKSCPPIINKAYTPANIETLLNQQTKKALNDSEFLKVDNSGKRVQFSKIMEWYGEDFKREASDLIAYANQYRANKIPADYKVGFYEYDWRLNKKWIEAAFADR